MKFSICLASVVGSVLIWLPSCATADSNLAYETQMLRGAKTAWFNFTETDDGVCVFHRGLSDVATPLLKEIENLGLRVIPTASVNAGLTPDLTVLVAVEANAVPEKVFSSGCTIFVKIEAVHSINGIPRHHAESMVLRVLAYRTIWFGTVQNAQVTTALQSTALHAIAKFGDEFVKANKP